MGFTHHYAVLCTCRCSVSILTWTYTYTCVFFKLMWFLVFIICICFFSLSRDSTRFQEKDHFQGLQRLVLYIHNVNWNSKTYIWLKAQQYNASSVDHFQALIILVDIVLYNTDAGLLVICLWNSFESLGTTVIDSISAEVLRPLASLKHCIQRVVLCKLSNVKLSTNNQSKIRGGTILPSE